MVERIALRVPLCDCAFSTSPRHRTLPPAEDYTCHRRNVQHTDPFVRLVLNRELLLLLRKFFQGGSNRL